MKFTLLHNRNCSKSKACLQILENESIDFKIRDYIKDPLSLEDIKDLPFDYYQLYNCELDQIEFIKKKFCFIVIFFRKINKTQI